MQTGKSSHEVRPANWADFDTSEKEIRELVSLYIPSSRDRTVTAEEGYEILRERTRNDKDFLLIFYLEGGVPSGFMSADIFEGSARILMAYMPPKLAKPKTKQILDEFQWFFDKWSRLKKVTKQIFYTFREPGAHKFMLMRGWAHDVTIYKRELVS